MHRVGGGQTALVCARATAACSIDFQRLPGSIPRATGMSPVTAMHKSIASRMSMLHQTLFLEGIAECSQEEQAPGSNSHFEREMPSHACCCLPRAVLTTCTYMRVYIKVYSVSHSRSVQWTGSSQTHILYYVQRGEEEEEEEKTKSKRLVKPFKTRKGKYTQKRAMSQIRKSERQPTENKARRSWPLPSSVCITEGKR